VVDLVRVFLDTQVGLAARAGARVRDKWTAGFSAALCWRSPKMVAETVAEPGMYLSHNWARGTPCCQRTMFNSHLYAYQLRSTYVTTPCRVPSCWGAKRIHLIKQLPLPVVKTTSTSRWLALTS